MAKKKGVRIRILVEDEALERFTRHALLCFGFSGHELRVTPYSVGRGSAKDHVEKQYPGEVRVFRSKAFQKIGLLVGTDADEQTVAHRFHSLAEALKYSGLAAREDDERIVLWIPRWNIETWILYFSGDRRDEEHNYKHDVVKPDFKAVGKSFVDEYREYKKKGAINTLSSLKTAYDETKRLKL